MVARLEENKRLVKKFKRQNRTPEPEKIKRTQKLPGRLSEFEREQDQGFQKTHDPSRGHIRKITGMMQKAMAHHILMDQGIFSPRTRYNTDVTACIHKACHLIKDKCFGECRKPSDNEADAHEVQGAKARLFPWI
jgi:hypothetical protein